MIKTFSDITCVFDCEWTPCPTTARRLLGLPADTDDRTATQAVWDHYHKESDKDGQPPFLKLVMSQVVSIARDGDARRPARQGGVWMVCGSLGAATGA